jgi:hypothetical protein
MKSVEEYNCDNPCYNISLINAIQVAILKCHTPLFDYLNKI